MRSAWAEGRFASGLSRGRAPAGLHAWKKASEAAAARCAGYDVSNGKVPQAHSAHRRPCQRVQLMPTACAVGGFTHDCNTI